MSYGEQRAANLRLPYGLIITGVLMMIVLFGGLLVGCPNYNVYKQELDGKAELAKATYSKQAAVQQAIAKEESAVHEKNSEITRAEGAAAAIKITGAELQKNPEYLRYLYVNNLADSHDQIIYVPTEGGFPIMEAGRGASINSIKQSPTADAIPTK